MCMVRLCIVGGRVVSVGWVVCALCSSGNVDCGTLGGVRSGWLCVEVCARWLCGAGELVVRFPA